MRFKNEEEIRKKLVIVRGGGDLATGTVQRLFRGGFAVIVLESPAPSAIRRHVALSEAVYDGKATVEDITAVRVLNWEEAVSVLKDGNVPLIIDTEAALLKQVRPVVLVDAIIAKRNLGTSRDMAGITIALGPGFEAGKDVDIVIETARGHNLGRLIFSGFALKNTGIPGEIGGHGKDRVIHAPADGVIKNIRKISDTVKTGDKIADIDGTPVTATIPGILRGLIRDGFKVRKGLKIADIDPRLDERDNSFTISDKARSLGGGVLEAILYLSSGRGV